MASMPFAISYPDRPHSPRWGTPTSAANFCEEDYIVTQWIAEFVSTLTNIAYVLYAVAGIRRLNKSKLRSSAPKIPYYGLASVGVCSGFFHATMHYYSQWMDDLSMLVAVTTGLHRLLTFDKTEAETVKISWWVFGLTALFSVYHCVTDEIILHRVFFGLLLVGTVIKSRMIVMSRKDNKAYRKRAATLTYLGVVSFVMGFTLWNIDFAACDTLRAWRRRVGMPLGFVLELHGWWHVLTAVGSYALLVLVEDLCWPAKIRKPPVSLAWPASTFLKS